MKSKNEIKQTYKETKFRSGVYQIRNINNKKIFIDSSTDLDAIWNRHKFQLNNNLHPNINLQREWTKFGQQNFDYEILSEIKTDDAKTINYRKEAKELAILFIEERQPFDDKGYNKRV